MALRIFTASSQYDMIFAQNHSRFDGRYSLIAFQQARKSPRPFCLHQTLHLSA